MCDCKLCLCYKCRLPCCFKSRWLSGCPGRLAAWPSGRLAAWLPWPPGRLTAWSQQLYSLVCSSCVEINCNHNNNNNNNNRTSNSNNSSRSKPTIVVVAWWSGSLARACSIPAVCRTSARNATASTYERTTQCSNVPVPLGEEGGSFAGMQPLSLHTEIRDTWI